MILKRRTECPGAPGVSMTANVPAFVFTRVRSLHSSMSHHSQLLELLLLGGLFIQLAERARAKLELAPLSSLAAGHKWRKSVVKSGGGGQSGQAIKLF